MDKRLAWLGVGAFAMSTVGFVFSSLLPPIANELGISIPRAGYLITAFSLAYAVGAPLLSALAGALDRRRVIAAAMLVFVAGCLAAAMGTSFAAVLAAQVVMGASAGLFAATAQATAVSLVDPEHRARAVSVVLSGTTFAVALGAPAGALIAGLWGWRGAFAAVALLGFSSASILWMRLPAGLRGARLTLTERLTAIAQPGVLPAIAVTLLYLAGGFIVISYLAPLAAAAGLPPLMMPAVLLAFGVGAVIGNLASGYLADRIGATRVVVLGLLASSALSVVLALGLKLLPDPVAGPALIAFMILWGVIGWTFPPAQASRIVAQAPQLAHLTLSLNLSAMYLGIGLGTAIGGRILELAPPADLGFAAALPPLLALGVLWAGSAFGRPAAAAP